MCDSSADRTDLLMHRATEPTRRGPECEQTRAGDGAESVYESESDDRAEALVSVHNPTNPMTSRGLLTDDSVLLAGRVGARRERLEDRRAPLEGAAAGPVG